MSGAKKGIETVRKIGQALSNTKGFDRLFADVSCVSVGEGKLVAEITVAEEHCNHYGSMHGGMLAYLVDTVTTASQMYFDPNMRAGMSTDMHVTYQKAAMRGDTIVIEASTLKTGKNLAYLSCVIRNKKDNSVVATGSHTKFTGGPFNAAYKTLE